MVCSLRVDIGVNSESIDIFNFIVDVSDHWEKRVDDRIKNTVCDPVGALVVVDERQYAIEDPLGMFGNVLVVKLDYGVSVILPMYSGGPPRICERGELTLRTPSAKTTR